jgi:hypothetical protein
VEEGGSISGRLEAMTTPFQMLVMMFAGWVNEHQRSVIAYLQEENRELRELHGIPRSTSIRARAFVSTTCEPSRFPLGPTTASVQLDACASSPIYLSMGVLLLGLWVTRSR